ncbi:MAG TPA: ABC transporter substrate-binding protein [Dehalococcoidia bacterium]|nr:ABC transporter substrate-binding protein [Dehalococcoidia bacterium]
MKKSHFPSLLIVVFALIAFVMLVAVACGGSSEEAVQKIKAAATAVPAASSGGAPTAVVQATEVPSAGITTSKVETLIAAISPPPIELILPWRGTNLAANQQVRPFADPLIATEGSSGKLVPGLAESWEMTKADGTEWVFHLKKGVQFHDGWGEFTAKDFIHTVTRVALQEDSIATDQFLLRQLFGETEEEIASNLTAPDPYTLVMGSKGPNADGAFIASAQQGNVLILSEAQWAAEGLEGIEKNPAGTGPYEMDEFELGSHIRYQRVEDHWRVTPAFEAYQQNTVPEVATRMAMMLAGEAHIAEIDRDLHPRVVERGMEVVNSQLPAIQFAFIMGGNYRSDLADRYDPSVPVTNIKVREAINRAVDRQEIIDTLFAGNGVFQPVWAYHPALPGYDPSWSEQFDEKYGYDPERAKELLAEAGYPDGFTMQLKITQLPGLPEMIPAAEALFGYLSAIGIKVEAEEMEWAKVRSNYRGKTTHNWIYPIRGTYRPAQVTLRFYNVSALEGFISSYENKEIDELYDRLINSVDADERAGLLRDIGQIKFDNYGEVPIAWLPGQLIIDPSVVKSFIYPGNINASFSHIEDVVPAD